MKSNHLRRVEGQGELPLSKCAAPNSMPIETIRSRKDKGHAFTLACTSSGLLDKEIYAHDLLDIDAGYFSKMKSGSATLDNDLLPNFCTVVGNNIYPEWLAWQMGCTLVLVKSEAERRIEHLEQKLAEKEIENRALVNAMHGKTA